MDPLAKPADTFLPLRWAKRLIAKSASQKATKNLFVSKAGFIGEYEGGIARRVLRQNEKLVLLAPAPKNQVSQTRLSGAKKSTAIMKMRDGPLLGQAPDLRSPVESVGKAS